MFFLQDVVYELTGEVPMLEDGEKYYQAGESASQDASETDS